MEKPEIFICGCHSTEHQFIFRYDEDDNLIYVDIHLTTHKNIFKRIYYAVKYIFGYKCRFGNFDEFILSKDDVPRFKKLLEQLDNKKE